MNKRRSKAIKELADMLPAAYVIRDHTETATLLGLMKMAEEHEALNIDLPEVTDENRDQVFKVKGQAMEVLNHHKRLKKAWKEKGIAGIQQYIIWLDRHNRAFALRMKDMEVGQVPQGLIEIANAKISSFWKMLIAFLFSFLTIFKSNDDNSNPGNS